MANLLLSWLGPPKIELDGRPLQLEMRKSLALLAYLSLSPQSPTRETLATLFWAEFDQQHAQSSLRRSLASLMKSLPAGLLEADRERIGLKSEDWLEVDVREFRELLATAQKHSHATDLACPDCIPALEKAISLYRGDFFEGFTLKDCPEFDEWQFFHRESLRSEYGGTLQKLAGYYQNQCEWERAIPLARSWLALDRLDEQAHRMLMRLYFLSGQRSAALRQYVECKQLLDQELGQPPEPLTLELYKEIRSSKPPEKEHRPLVSRNGMAKVPATPTIITKFLIPKVPRAMVERSRLVSLLEMGIQLPLTVISAAAGFGKTTLLAEWASKTLVPVAWVGLDHGDNDPRCLISYLISTIRNALPAISAGAEALELLRSPTPLPHDEILASFINDLLLLTDPVVLVLDDYQLIQAQEAHNIIRFLLEHQPDTLHLILSTRVDPPLSLARMRANHAMLEIRADDLRFTIEEARTFLNDRVGLDLSEQDIDLLDKRTEGWIAGFRMISLAVQTHGKNDIQSRRELIQTIRGSQRYIMDYLIEEVLNGLPVSIRDFLMRTSIFERFCAPLCGAVFHDLEQTRSDSPGRPSLVEGELRTFAQILEYLDRTNVFLIPLDENRFWYRYHHLFADLLRVRMKQTIQELEIRKWHHSAAIWYEENGMINEAINHSFAASDYEHADHLSETWVKDFIIQREDVKMIANIDALPAKVFENHPWLCVSKAIVQTFSGRLDEAEHSLQISGEVAGSCEDLGAELKDLRGILYWLHAHISEHKGNLQAAREWAIKADECLVSKSHLRIQVLGILGDISFLDGNYGEATRIWSDLADLSRSTGYHRYLIVSFCVLARLNQAQGRLGAAFKHYQDALDAMSRLNRMYPGCSREIYIGMSDLYLEQNQLEKAEDFVQLSKQHIHPESLGVDVFHILIHEGRLLIAKKDYPEAQRILEKAGKEFIDASIYPDLIAEWEAARVRLWLLQGNVSRAAQWAEVCLRKMTDYIGLANSYYCRVLEQSTIARVWIAQGDLERAEIQLKELAGEVRKKDHKDLLIDILVLLAVTLALKGCMEEAFSVATNSLMIARPEDYARKFIDEGPRFMRILQLGKQQGVWQEPELSGYVDKLLFASERE